MMSAISIGDRFTLAEEGIAGVVSDVFRDGFGEIASIVVKMDGGGWAAVDVTLIEPRVLH